MTRNGGAPLVAAMLIGLMAVDGAAPTRRASASDAPERAADARDKVICKRFVRTGSLVDGYRTCKTKWEWERERENLRQQSVSDSCRDRANGGALCS
ncbi:hypothetical protein KZ813_02365 [Sphingomonas sp. RHCKR7]|uniref:hypothetical protein n=1 Tax=Sphingomonas folli TaxID=2862497 RepID=UPI001CA5A6D3|nr:hypothetical protein [Sphingomonas folli]MBW6525679.1 hypothetical protein [Sphingomonas folli]